MENQMEKKENAIGFMSCNTCSNKAKKTDVFNPILHTNYEFILIKSNN